MACTINADTIRNGFNTLLDRELTSSDIFEKEGRIYLAKSSQIFAAQEFVRGINRRFSEDVIKRISDRRFEISIPDSLLIQYLKSSPEGLDIYNISKLYYDSNLSPDSWNYDSTFMALNYPEINEFTYEKLVSFVKSLNPNFRVEEVNNLSQGGITKLKDFLIQVRTMERFSALPEEVAHVLVELLPDDNPLKIEAISNITSFSIYSETLNQYKNIYTLSDGRPDYNKIKREAIAKLIGEYVTALATNNYSRVQELTKPRQGWLKSWFSKFLEWLGLGMRENTHIYGDIAGLILSGHIDTSLKTEKEISDLSYTDSYFYKLTDQQAYEQAYELMTAKPPGLLNIISRFSKEFGRRFNDILKDEKYAELNNVLMKEGKETTKINKLSEIKIILAESGIDLRAAVDSDIFRRGLKEFIEAIDKLDILSDSILKVVKSKEKSKDLNEAIKNIDELQGYLGLYSTFNNIISAELAQVLIDSNVASDTIESIQRSQLSFKNVNDHILNRLRHDLFIFYKGTLQSANDIVSQTLANDMEKFKDDPKAMALLQKRVEKLIVKDEDILKMLSGRGTDIDNVSTVNHLINAAYANGDVYVSGIANYIQTKIEKVQTKASREMRTLSQKIDDIQKALKEDAVTTGEKISFIDKVLDSDTGEIREVLTWLNPHKDIHPVLEKHRLAVREAAIKRFDSDKNTESFKKADAEFKKVQKDYYDFLEKYFNRPFVTEYYNFQKKYEDDTYFINAMQRWRDASDDIRVTEGLLEIEPEDEELWKQLAQAKRSRSNLLSEYDEDGYKKSEEVLKEVNILKSYFDEQSKFREIDEVQTRRAYLISENRYKQKVEFAIAEVRKKNLDEIEDIENEIKTQLKDPRIRIVTLYDEGVPEPGGSIDYNFIKDILMEKWYKKNINIQKSEEFYKFEKAVRDELNELQNKGELSGVDLKLKTAYDALYGILYGTRNEIGHINPDSLTEEQKQEVIDLENYISELRSEKPPIGVDLESFTPEDRIRYEDYTRIIDDPNTTNRERIQAFRGKNKIAANYIDKGKTKTIQDLIYLLGSLTSKTPTSYYWDKLSTLIPHIAEFGKEIMNRDLSKEDKQEVLTFLNDFIDTIDREDWDRLDFFIYEKDLFDALLDWMRINRPTQYDWFMDNHREKSVFDHQNGEYTRIKYARSAIYTYSEPTRPEHQKIALNRKFTKYRVKNEYRTGYNPETGEVELKVGVHITNREYNGYPEFLPLLPEQGAPVDSPYHNQAYYNLKEKDPLRFQYLSLLRDADLEQQKKLPSRLKRWNQVPVMGLSNIEELDPKNIKNVAQQKIDYVKSILKKDTKIAEKDADAEEAAKGEDTAKEIDQFTQTTIQDRIPKLGMSQKIPIDRVSRDLLKSTELSILRAYEFEARTEAEPVVKALVTVMKDNEFKNQMSNKQRAKIFEKIYSQMILQEIPETTLNTKAVRRISKFITGNIALRLMADPIGGTINYLSAMVNNVIEASAGQYLNIKDLTKGKALAFKVTTSLAADYNKKANLSINTLLFQTFDFLQGEFEEDLLDRSSSKDKHASVQQLLMIPRKSGELFAQSAVAMGILDRYKVKNQIDGKEYPVHEIYTRDESGNNLKLKEGFWEYKKDADGKDTTEKIYPWNPIDGDKFFKIKKLINHVNHGLHGNYAKISQTEASRYAIGKLAQNMKRWFMPAFQRRFGRETIDITYEYLNEGYYRTTVRAARNIFGSMLRLDFAGGGRWFNFFVKTPRYRQNLQRTATEAGIALLLWTTFALILGYSGDDKNKELEKNSWIHNVAILILIRAYSETTAYIPFPPFGFQEMKRNVLTPLALPSDSVSNFAAIFQLGVFQLGYWFGIDSLKDSLYYQKDSGFWYSEKGDSKLLKYILNSIGHTGYTINPDQYIKNFDNLQKRLK